MKFYVAGRWEDRQEVQEIQRFLCGLDMELTLDWTQHEYPIGEKDLEKWAKDDLVAASQSSLLVAVMEQQHDYKGAWCEIGACLARGGIVNVIGHDCDSAIFLHHPRVVRFDTKQLFYECWKGSVKYGRKDI